VSKDWHKNTALFTQLRSVGGSIKDEAQLVISVFVRVSFNAETLLAG